MSFSKWHGVDLHIHSKKSNVVKGKNDFVGEEYSAKELLDVLIDNDISIFSITDHNCLNTTLYADICTLLRTEEYSEKISVIVGMELDVFDDTIHSDVFHCLCFVDTLDFIMVEKAINCIFDNKPENERNDVNAYPNVSKIFKALANNDIHDVLLIPHFNNKNKGIGQEFAVEHLNYLCFNAYEDSNNIAGITKSLEIYLKSGFDNFPFAVFSDCHNLSVYPKMKNIDEDRNPTKCYMLSNLKYPFNSVKTAFEEPRMRISIESVNNMRNKVNNELYLREIYNNGETIELSPYQNTIVGKFGSGKSLLMEKIKEGKECLKEHSKYKEFYKSNEEFKIKVGESSFDSLEEALITNNQLRTYDFLQQEEFYFKNELGYSDVVNLFKRLNIDFDFNSSFTKLNLSDTISSDLIDSLVRFENTTVINNFNYERAFSEENYYSFSLNRFNHSEYKSQYDFLLRTMKTTEESLIDLKKIQIHNVDLFSVEDLTSIDNLLNILNIKTKTVNHINESNFEKKIHNRLQEYKDQLIDNNAKESKDNLISDYRLLIESIKKSKDSVSKFEKNYNKQVYDTLFEENTHRVNDNLEIVYSYQKDNVTFESLNKRMFTDSETKPTFFQSWIRAVYYNKKLRQNKPLRNVDQYMESYIRRYNDMCDINKTTYDLKYAGDSMLKKSAGEKSSKFIMVVFELIEQDLLSGKSVILTLDQPEDNIDNDNTYVLIAQRIKELKLEYIGFQIIVVTHNANVGIAADSENIIIAHEIDQDQEKNFSYISGSIENREHIKEVCKVLEGGVNALKRRTIKYGVNIIRKVEQNEI